MVVELVVDAVEVLDGGQLVVVIRVTVVVGPGIPSGRLRLI